MHFGGMVLEKDDLLHISAKINIEFHYFKFEFQFQFSKKYLIHLKNNKDIKIK